MYLKRRLLRLARVSLPSFKTLGARTAVVFWSQRAGLPLERSGESYTLRARGCAHPLYARPGSTDAFVFRNVFVEREYGCVDDLPDVRLIVDCGANVGYASAYFLARHPRARVVA